MNTFMTTFYLFLLLSFSPLSESHRKHLLQFSPVPDVSISFIPTSSPSEIPSNSPNPTPPIPPSIPSKHSHPPSPLPPSNPSHSAPPSPLPPSNPSHSPPPSPLPPSDPSNSPLPSPIPPSPSPVPSPSPSWCVAKPSAPEDKVQEAMDYACGAGGADCTEIRPGGACFYPDTVMAHASFAFNSYWQTEKNRGGSCDFGGAAIVVISDPSFQGCHFKLD